MKRKHKELLVKEIPVELAAKHPHTGYDELPRHEFSMGI